MSARLKVSLSLSKKSDGSQLFYKIDGERFKENKTIKLHVDTVYKVTVDVEPAKEIRLAKSFSVNHSHFYIFLYDLFTYFATVRMMTGVRKIVYEFYHFMCISLQGHAPFHD